MSTWRWRPMVPSDMADVIDMADRIHLDYPEDMDVFAEKQALFPQGTVVLEVEGESAGYLFSHPWRYADPPALNSLLEEIPAHPDTYYIHDLALAERARGLGAAAKAVETVVQITSDLGLPTISLVAVGGSDPFWKRQGFSVVHDESLAEKLKSYGDDALFMVRST